MNDGLHTYKFQLFGHVQGVGMRFSIKMRARKTGLVGAVKNCLDGSVEGIIQGTKIQTEAFFSWLKEKAPGRIDRVLKEKMPSSQSFQTFTIEH